jgi:hypothetical protein
LFEWQSPAAMSAAVEQIMDRLGGKDLFNQSGLEFLRNGWVAGRYGSKRGAESVRLVAAERPDFELRTGAGAVELFEVVEAGIPGRKRGLEYRDAACQHMPVEQWATNQDALEAIRAMAVLKAENAQKLAAAGAPYPPGTALLIYLNLRPEFGAQQQAIEAVFDAAVQPAKTSFSAIWILWKKRIYRI